jgi:hypothetical protein
MFTEKFSVPTQNVFSDWKDLVAAGKLADAVVVSTQDKMHRDCAVALVDLGRENNFFKLKFNIYQDTISCLKSLWLPLLKIVSSLLKPWKETKSYLLLGTS